VRYAGYQWMRIDESPLYNTALFDEASDSMIHYRRDVYIALAADRPMDHYVVGSPTDVLEAATGFTFGGGGPSHGDVAIAGGWDLGMLAPKQSVTLTLFWTFGKHIGKVRQLLAEARATGTEALLAEVREYWRTWLARATPLDLSRLGARGGRWLPGIPDAATPEQIQELYHRSLLVFKLMSDEQTGAVIAAPEFDPEYTRCGGYAYCWGRDAAFIATAMDYAGYHDLAGGFYRWTLCAQEEEGWWAHRHYSSGQWASSWGLLQVDETGSILYGMAIHAKVHGGEAFARMAWPNVKKAAEWLLNFMDPETGLPKPSWDLWEERQSELAYSAAAVYGGLLGAAGLADLVGEAEAAARWRRAAGALQAAVLRECVRNGRFLRGRYVQVGQEAYEAAQAAGEAVRIRRGTKGYPIYEVAEDPVADASLLGMATPFRLVEPSDPVMTATAAYLTESLWMAPGGGMLRCDGDQYQGGRNPWVLATCWLGQYEADRGNPARAMQILDWAVARRTAAGLLPEQVDAVSGAPVWVVPLTWSHAMYVLLALRLLA